MNRRNTRVSLYEYNSYVDYYISCLANALELSLKRSGRYYTICKQLHKKKIFRKREFARLFGGYTRHVLQDLANSGVFNKGRIIGFMEKFYLANELPTPRGRIVAPTDVGVVVSEV